jgi:hypothetical protein
MSALNRIVNYLLRWLRWLGKPRLGWVPVLVLAIAVVGAFWLRSEPAFRRIGLVLQLLGIATVAWNIRGTRALFGRPGAFVQWWHEHPRWSWVVVADAAGGIEFLGRRPRVDIWHNADADAALEARLDAMGKNLSWVRDRLNEFQQETEKDLEQQTNALEQEKRVRASDDKGIHEKLVAAQIGGLNISVAGMWWLVVGVIMSTVPSESVCLANFIILP